MKPDTVTAQGVRLQKVIAQAGVTSRRKAEALIVQGRVIVNGKKITTLGSTVDPTTDSVVVDGKPPRLHTPCAMCCSTSRVAMSPRVRMSNAVARSSTCSNGSRYGSFQSDVWM